MRIVANLLGDLSRKDLGGQLFAHCKSLRMSIYNCISTSLLYMFPPPVKKN